MSQLDAEYTGDAKAVAAAPEPKQVQVVSATIQLTEDEDALAVAAELAKLGEIQNLSIFKQNQYGPNFY